jgi:hypothetical protein
VRYTAAKSIVRGLKKNRQGEVEVDGNIDTDVLMHIYMVEKASMPGMWPNERGGASICCSRVRSAGAATPAAS